jgi:thymidylate synthase (FAD)
VSGIRVITEPRVYHVGSQVVDDDELSKFLADEGVSGWVTDSDVGGQKLVEISGRLCYMSFKNPRPGGNSAYINHILESGHGSVLEHAVFNLIIAGVSRGFSHEMVRHRAGFSFSQLSQRYVDESDVAFVVPPALMGGDDTRDPNLHFAYHAWRRSCVFARDCYIDVVYRLGEMFADEPDATARRKKAREAARSVLPNAAETKLFMSGNGRSWRHFLELRGHASADAEMRRVARAVLDVLRTAAPNIFGDYTVTDEGIETPYRKV